MTKYIETSPNVVMISGHFDGFHDGHLDYIKQAVELAGLAGIVECVVSTDKQLLIKKGKVNVPEKARVEIVELILGRIAWHSFTSLNVWDTETTLIANYLRQVRPDILFRGYDKRLETMPIEERKVCDELGIKIVHAVNRIGERHSSEMVL